MACIGIDVPAIPPRHYQVPVFQYWLDRPPGSAPGRAVDVWARRGGKDLTYASVALSLSFERPGLYVHFLPEFAHARRTLWDGYLNDGRKFIDAAFPRELRKATHQVDMRIELANGSVWQLGGCDQYDRWVGGNPIFCVFSEYAIADPRAWEHLRPILKVNGGGAAFISTPRGYNHLHDMLTLAKREPAWRWSVRTALDMGVMTQADIDDEVRQGMPEELARQEYLCDFSAANVGSVLGKYIEAAEREGRIEAGSLYDPGGAGVVISSDIGFRDTAAFWFWQPVLGGFNLIDYVDGTGMDAEQWIDVLQSYPYYLERIYLPHDARAKTFQSRHTVVERFVRRYGTELIRVTPSMKSGDKINAARSILPRCRFDVERCAPGLAGLRGWSFAWDDGKKVFGREPVHDWASHPADSFCYGASILREALPPPKPKPRDMSHGVDGLFSIESLTRKKRQKW